MHIEEIVERAINDRTLSATTIVQRMLQELGNLNFGCQEIKPFITLAQKERPSMPLIANALSEVSSYLYRGSSTLDATSYFWKKLYDMVHISIKNTVETLGDSSSIATISYSSNVKTSLLQLRSPKVMILESKPGKEGETLFKELDNAGLETKLLPDSCACYASTNCDVALVGADAVYDDGFLNKVGTRQLFSCFSNHNKYTIGNF